MPVCVRNAGTDLLVGFSSWGQVLLANDDSSMRSPERQQSLAMTRTELSDPRSSVDVSNDEIGG